MSNIKRDKMSIYDSKEKVSQENKGGQRKRRKG